MLSQLLVCSPNPVSAHDKTPLFGNDECLFAVWNLWQAKLQDVRKSINLIFSAKVVLLG